MGGDKQTAVSVWSEADRLSALARYEILDTAPEADFDDVVRIAAHICGVPVALISLVDDRRQWFKAALGIDARETPREIAFCDVAIQQNELLVVPDATQDPRFSQNPLVTENPSIRFYAGAQLVTPDGFPLGTLCVIDDKPRELTTDQRESLEALARQVIVQMELRAAIARQKADEAHRALLVGELQHRVKNTLSLVQALVSQTLRNADSMGDAKLAIEDRLVALSRAYDLLGPTNVAAAAISAVVASALEAPGVEARVRAEGPDFQVKPRAALALAMVLHELATNAAKYGALSNPAGRIDIAWAIRGEGDAALFEMSWQEAGGPPVVRPNGRGFGSRLIGASMAGDLAGTGGVEYLPDGVRWTLTSRRDQIVDV